MQLDSQGEEVKTWQKFLGVTADGVFGEETEQRTKTFQRRHNLREDGKVGPNTLSVAKEFGYRATLDNVRIDVCLPESGNGFVGYNRESNGADQYGTARTIDAIQKIAAKWFAHYPELPMQIGDISRKGGGKFPPHLSHRNGRDFDMRPFRKDGKRLPVIYKDANYDRVMTEEFVRFVRSDYPNATIYFNDPKLIAKNLTAHCAGHDNHLHFRLF